MGLSTALRGKCANEDESGKPILDEILAATVSAGIDNAKVAQQMALNDGTLDTYPKIMDAVRSFARACRGCNLSAVGDPKDVDASTKGKGKGKKGKGEDNEKERSSKSENKDATYNQSDTECFHCKTKGHIARHCKKRINDENAGRDTRARRRPRKLRTSLRNCAHVIMTHRHMLTAAPCSRLATKSHHALVRSHCSCTSHGIVLNASRNLEILMRFSNEVFEFLKM